MAATVESLPSVWPKPPGVFETAHLEEAHSCLLCSPRVLASVQLRPCVHKLCSRCAQQTPAKDSLKTDTAVRCPICRQFVEEIVPLTGKVIGVDSLATVPAPPSKPSEAGTPNQEALPGLQGLSGLGGGSLAPRFWKCLHCGQAQNSGYAHVCSDCGRLRPDNIFPQPPQGKDTRKYDLDEILAACQTKWHPDLNRAFLEAGVPLSNGVIQGDRESILSAFRRNGQEKLVKIVRTIAGSCRIFELCQNLFANYAIQDLMEGLAKLREIAKEDRKLNLPQAAADNLSGVTSAFGLLLDNLLETLCEMSVHPTCFHVVKRLMHVCNLDELCAITSKLLSRCMEMASNEKGCYVLDALLESLIACQRADCDTYQIAKARTAVASVASAMYGRFQMMTWIACNSPVGGSILLRILHGSLPLYSGLQVGSFLASYAHELVQTKMGTKLVLDMLSMQSTDSRDVLRDLVCCTALSLQGRMASYAVFEPIDGRQLIKVLIQRLVDESEIDWATVIAKELLIQGEDLLRNEFGREVLLLAFSLDLVQHQTVEMFIEKMASEGLGNQILQDMVLHNHGENRQAEKGPGPHWRNSIISPWLKFHIDSGNEILAPPAAPPQHEQSYGKFQHVPPPQHDPSERNCMMASPVGRPGMKSSIWTDNLGFPPAPPMPNPYQPLSSVPEHLLGLDHPPSAKLPADLMESLNSDSPEASAEIDRHSGVVEFGEIPAPPPAMYRYPGNWNFPDMGNSEFSAADLDVSGVISQFQGTMIGDHPKSRVHEMVAGNPHSPGTYGHLDVIGLGETPRSEGISAPRQISLVSTIADVQSAGLESGLVDGGAVLRKGSPWEGQVQDVVGGVRKADGMNFAYNRISRDQPE